LFAPGGGVRKQTPLPGKWANFMMQALTGVDDDFRPDGGIASIPPGDRRNFGRRSFRAPVMYL
jgi:hypothetical protein